MRILAVIPILTCAHGQTGGTVRGYDSGGRLLYEVSSRWAHLFPRRPSMLIIEDFDSATTIPPSAPSCAPLGEIVSYYRQEWSETNPENIWQNTGGNCLYNLLLSASSGEEDLNEKLNSILLVGSMMASEDEKFLHFGLQFSQICQGHSEAIISIVTNKYAADWSNRFHLLGSRRMEGGNREAIDRAFSWLLTPFWNLDSVCPELLMKNNDIFRIVTMQRMFRELFLIESRNWYSPRAIINREEIIESSANELFNGNFFQFWETGEIGGLFVTFAGEHGIDHGGVFVDWISSVGRALVMDNILVPTEEDGTGLTINFEKEISPKYLQLIGAILGLSILNDAVIGIPISVGLFKYLLDEGVVLENIKNEFPQLYKNLKNFDPKIVSDIVFAVGETDLIPGGSSIVVTDENLGQFQRVMADWKLVRIYERHFAQIKHGFEEILGENYIEKFSPVMNAEKMQKIFCGDHMEPQVQHVLRIIQYEWNDIPRNERVIHQERMEEFLVKLSSVNRLGDFVTFVTGMRQVDPRPLIISFGNYGDPDNRFPSVSTCIRTLRIPVYSTDEIFESRMMTALDDTGSREFGLH